MSIIHYDTIIIGQAHKSIIVQELQYIYIIFYKLTCVRFQEKEM
jgi:hypothetical protein